MAETKEITRLYVITDSETSYDNIGDIDGGLFDENWLESYIKSYGASPLLEKLAYMSYQILKTVDKINHEIEESYGKPKSNM